jgi:hypothetical protein
MFETDVIDAESTTAPAATEQSQEFRDYKVLVKRQAIAAKREMGWDTADMNKNLVLLGCEPVEEYALEVPIKATHTWRATIDPSGNGMYLTRERAMAAFNALSDTSLAANLLAYSQWQIAERGDPVFTIVGTADAEPDPVSLGNDLDAYKKLVRRTAIRVQKERRWCEEGIGRYLRALGLPQKQRFQVPVEVTLRQVTTVTVDDAESFDEARENLNTQHVEEAAALLTSRGASVVSHEVKARLSGDDMLAGQRPDPTLAGAGADSDSWCRNEGVQGYVCSLEPGHEGQHVAGNGSRIVTVWPQGTGNDYRR